MTHEKWGSQWQIPEGAGRSPVQSTGSTHAPTRRHARKRRRGTARRVLLTATGVLVLVIGWGAWLAADGLSAYDDLREAAGLVSTFEEQALAGDVTTSSATLADLQGHATAARDALHGPQWWLATKIPRLGENVVAVQVVSEVVDDLSQRTLPSLLEVLDQVDPGSFALVDGRLDLAPIAAAAPTVLAAQASVRDQLARIDALPATGLLTAVAEPVADLSSQLARVDSTMKTAVKAVVLLPAMLGAEGPRDYLLLVQNTAEPRATGGIPGSVLLLRADAGAVTIVDQRSGGDLGNLPAPVVELSAEELSLFGTNLGADMRDVNFTPDFPRSAQIAASIWSQEVGGEVDGVVSMDPGTLALVLGATGPVPMPPGPVARVAGDTLTAENASQVLLNQVYLSIFDPAAQDLFFNATAATVFAAAASGQGDPSAMVDALVQAADQDRLMVWSAHEDEQVHLTGTVISGDLRGADGDSPVLGVYLNDGTAAKMGHYLRAEVSVGSDVCVAGARTVTVDVTLTSTAPADAADLPSYLTGGGNVVPEGEVRTNVLLYAPEGGLIDAVRVSDGPQGFSSHVHDGLAVAVVTTQLIPGASVTISYDVTTGHLPGPISIRATPLEDLWVKTTDLVPKCGSDV
ncbi:DUF4012 domain-containing protein [Sanguibacter suarezii]|uniref:DUF4012 domain-containing protein n=1 Tax=Sanguibacter suarezii TaxID=60921 RepID=UPI0014706A62|nr:DUF4012 domain-containing protein [Sanguibacter suarezii]